MPSEAVPRFTTSCLILVQWWIMAEQQFMKHHSHRTDWWNVYHLARLGVRFQDYQARKKTCISQHDTCIKKKMELYSFSKNKNLLLSFLPLAKLHGSQLFRKTTLPKQSAPGSLPAVETSCRCRRSSPAPLAVKKEVRRQEKPRPKKKTVDQRKAV